MRLLRSEVYLAMRALQYLRGQQKRVRSSAAIAAHLKCDASALRYVMSSLVKNDIVTVFPGRIGGYVTKKTYVSVHDLCVALGCINENDLTVLERDVSDVLKKVII